MNAEEIKGVLLDAITPQIERVADKLTACPPGGTGKVHSEWMAGLSMQLLRGFALSSEVAHDLIERCMSRPQSSASEIADTLRSAARKLGIKESGAPRRRGAKRLSPPRVSRDWASIAEIARTGCTLEAMSASSPGSLDFGPPAETAVFFLRRLFREGELVCLGRDVHSAVTRPLSEWLPRLGGMQFVVPNPMSKLTGTNNAGKFSTRCNDNTGARRFLVLDFDFKPDECPESAALFAEIEASGRTVKDLCAAVGYRLAEAEGRSPALVVDSGGKSLHFWFRVEGESEPAVHLLLTSAARLGADPALWTPSQLARLPGGIREPNQKEQRVVFWNPDALH